MPPSKVIHMFYLGDVMFKIISDGLRKFQVSLEYLRKIGDITNMTICTLLLTLGVN